MLFSCPYNSSGIQEYILGIHCVNYELIHAIIEAHFINRENYSFVMFFQVHLVILRSVELMNTNN